MKWKKKINNEYIDKHNYYIFKKKKKGNSFFSYDLRTKKKDKFFPIFIVYSSIPSISYLKKRIIEES